MITSKEVKQFLREKCEAVVDGIAPATPFSDEDKKRITATLKIISEANPSMTSYDIFNPGDFIDDAKYLSKHSAFRIAVYETEPNFLVKFPKGFDEKSIKRPRKVKRKIGS